MTSSGGDGLPRLQALWDYADPAATEARLRARLPLEPGGARLELLSQLARCRLLLGDRDGAGRILEQLTEGLVQAISVPPGGGASAAGGASRTGAAPDDVLAMAPLPGALGIARCRLLLERGRWHDDGRQLMPARACFEAAFAQGVRCDARYHAIDAAHMLAWIGVAPASWTERGLELALASPTPGLRRWIPTLLGNEGDRCRRVGALRASARAFGWLRRWSAAQGVPGALAEAELGLATVARLVHRPHAAVRRCVALLAGDLSLEAALEGRVLECLAWAHHALGAPGAAHEARRAVALLHTDRHLLRHEPGRITALEALASR